MGTPDFAVPALEKLLSSHHEVIGVYTQRPKPKGRGHMVQESPVHALALKFGLPVFTPSSLRTPEEAAILSDLKPDVVIVVAYGMILPQSILDVPKFGCINIHGSLLPRWRGAAPIHRALMAGDQTTGITIMKMDAGLDTGPMIMKDSITIKQGDTFQELYGSLSHMGARLLIKTLESYPCPMEEQPNDGVTYADKIKKEEAYVKWASITATELERYVRALNPWPGVIFQYQNQEIKILKAEVIEDKSINKNPGEILDAELTIACKEGSIRPMILQKSGKKPVGLKDFLNGTVIKKGHII